MQQLESLYEKKYKNRLFIDRKYKILYNKELIFAPPKSGKSHIIVDFLQNYKQEDYLYIDLSDLRVDKEAITKQKLETFIEKNGIKILAIEHFDFSFDIPKNVKKIILTTDLKEATLEGFKKRFLYPLDFEEFIAFDKKHFDIETLFNQYTNHSSFPSIVLHQENNYLKELQKLAIEIIKDDTEFKIFRKFCELQGHKVSLFQIYNQLKHKIKISKDSIYKISQKFQERDLVILLTKFNQPKASKKVYLFDFAIKNALTFNKDFLKRFDNMVFLELHKKSYQIYYTDFIDFFIPEKNLSIISAPFTPENILKQKIAKNIEHFKSLNISQTKIITLGNEAAFGIEGISFELIPFWNWALG